MSDIFEIMEEEEKYDMMKKDKKLENFYKIMEEEEKYDMMKKDKKLDNFYKIMEEDEKYDMMKKNKKLDNFCEIMNSDINYETNKKSKKDKRYMKIRKSVLICCLFSFVMVITFLTVLVTKLLFEMKSEKATNESEKASNENEEVQNNVTDTLTTYFVGSIKTITTQKDSIKTITTKGTTVTTTVPEPYTTSILEQATKVIKKPTQTPDIVENQGGYDEQNKMLYSNVIYSNPKDVMVSWKIQNKDELITNLEIKNINNKVRRDENINKSEDFVIDNDLTLSLTLQLKRIIEFDSKYSNNTQNEFIITPETEIQVQDAIQDYSNNVGGGTINLKRVFSSKNIKKQIEVEQKLFLCNYKCNYSQLSQLGDLDPANMSYSINLKKWDYIYKEPIIRFEFEVTSSKSYWSDESQKVVNFDKGQCLLNYFNMENSFNNKPVLPLTIEGVKDVYSNEEKSLLSFDLFMANQYSTDNSNPLMPVIEDKAVFHLQSDMNNYNILNTILSSGISSFKLQQSRNSLWLFTFFIFILHFLIL